MSTERSILLIANDLKSLNQEVVKNEFNSSIISRLEELNKTSDTFKKIINNVVIVHDKFLSIDWREDKSLIEKKDNLLKILNPK